MLLRSKRARSVDARADAAVSKKAHTVAAAASLQEDLEVQEAALTLCMAKSDRGHGSSSMRAQVGAWIC